MSGANSFILRRRTGLAGAGGFAIALGCLVGALVGCGDSGPPRTAVVTTELGTRWDLLPHRISILEITTDVDADALTGVLIGQNEGGPFGAGDPVETLQSFHVYSGRSLRSTEASITLEIPPSGTTNPEDHVTSGALEVDAGELAEADTIAAFLRGYRISTDEYETPPAFASDPDLPYDPADGFTTQGVGIELGEVTRVGTALSVPVRVRNSMGVSDRPDLNAAIPEASSWVRVDVTFVGVVGADAAVHDAEVEYTASTAEYGQATEHPRASIADQSVVVAGDPGYAGGLLGLRGFDVWVNVPGHMDPSCVVEQDEVNTWGEMVSGPGRYMTEMSAAIRNGTYDAATGQAAGEMDLYFSNSSAFKEVGNLCVGLRGHLTLLQVDEPLEEHEVTDVRLPLRPGQVVTETRALDPEPSE